MQLPNPDRTYSWGEHEVRPYVRATSNLALARERQGQYQEALALYQECLRICPHDGVQARFAIATVDQRMGNLHQSLLNNAAHCRGNLVDIPDPFYDMASALVQLDRPQETLDRLLEGLAINHHIAVLLLTPRREKVTPESMGVDSPEWAAAYVHGHRDLWPAAAIDLVRKVMGDPTLRRHLEQIEELEVQCQGESRREPFKRLSDVRQRVFAPRAVKALKQRLKLGGAAG